MIYEPSGKAREYSPLAMNLYKGCGHGCIYCYVPQVLKMDRAVFDSFAEPKKDVIRRIDKSVKKHNNESRQVLMSFTTDPYNRQNEKYQLTNYALEKMLQNKIPVSILTKSKSVLNDLELIKSFGEHIKVGFTLTFVNKMASLKYEPNASTPGERFAALKNLKEAGVRTWASLEPVINPMQTLDIIDITHQFVDEYQVGKVNHVKSKVDWKMFSRDVVLKLRRYGKEFYIKNDLAKFCDMELTEKETDMDYLTVKGW